MIIQIDCIGDVMVSKNPAGIKLQYFCQHGDKKKTKNKVKHIYFRH
jgi:hypothetical protein